MNDPYRLRYTNQFVGAFLLLLLLFVLAFTILFVRTNDILVEKDEYWVHASQDEVEGLRKGSEILILGERAGEVASITYRNGSSDVLVTLKIHPEFRDSIFESSIIAMERRFGVGAPILIIRRGEADQDELKTLHPSKLLKQYQGEEDRLDQLAREVDSVSQSIRKIQVKLDPTLEQVSKSAVQLENTLADDASPAFQKMDKASDAFLITNSVLRPKANQTLDEIQAATKNLDSRISKLTERIEKLVDLDMRNTLKEMRVATDDVSKAAGSVDNAAGDVNTDVADTLVELRDAAEKVQKLADEARDVVRIVRKEADVLPGTTKKLNSTADDARNLVGEIRSHWLLRRYTDQSPTTRQVSPSGVRGGGP